MEDLFDLFCREPSLEIILRNFQRIVVDAETSYTLAGFSEALRLFSEVLRPGDQEDEA
jgi:hypothetical protein